MAAQFLGFIFIAGQAIKTQLTSHGLCGASPRCERSSQRGSFGLLPPSIDRGSNEHVLVTGISQRLMRIHLFQAIIVPASTRAPCPFYRI